MDPLMGTPAQVNLPIVQLKGSWHRAFTDQTPTCPHAVPAGFQPGSLRFQPGPFWSCFDAPSSRPAARSAEDWGPSQVTTPVQPPLLRHEASLLFAHSLRCGSTLPVCAGLSQEA